MSKRDRDTFVFEGQTYALHGRCPVCHKPLQQDYADTDEGRVNAKGLSCQEMHNGKEHYTYEYATGCTKVTVGDEEFLMSYTDSKESQEDFWDRVNAAAKFMGAVLNRLG